MNNEQRLTEDLICHEDNDSNIGRTFTLCMTEREKNFDEYNREFIKCSIVGYFYYKDRYSLLGFDPSKSPMCEGDRIYRLEETEKIEKELPRPIYYRSATQLFGLDIEMINSHGGCKGENMSSLTEIVCPECGSKLEVYWYADAGTSVIACNNEECKFMTEIGNKVINSAFYEQYYNKMKYKEDLQREMELRHG